MPPNLTTAKSGSDVISYQGQITINTQVRVSANA